MSWAYSNLKKHESRPKEERGEGKAKVGLFCGRWGDPLMLED